MKKVKKGNHGYISYQKIRTLLITFLLFAVPILIYVSGVIYFKTNLNVCTIIAAVGCIPACKSLVSLIMISMQRPISDQMTAEIAQMAPDLLIAYELVMTTYEHTYPVNALAICGTQVVAYTPDEKAVPAELEKHLTRILTVNGLPQAQPKVMKDYKKFLQRIHDLNQKCNQLRDGIEFTPDSRYPDLGFEELIYHNMLAISL